MDIVRQSLAITLVFALLWVALWLLRKKSRLPIIKSRSGGELESRGKLALSAQHSLHVVRIGERELVLGVYPGGMALLCDFGPRAPDAIEGAEQQ